MVLYYIVIIFMIIGLVISRKEARQASINAAKMKLMHDEIMKQNAEKQINHSRYGK